MIVNTLEIILTVFMAYLAFIARVASANRITLWCNEGGTVVGLESQGPSSPHLFLDRNATERSVWFESLVACPSKKLKSTYLYLSTK